METKGNLETSDTVSMGIVIGVIDIIVMLGIIAIICTMDFGL